MFSALLPLVFASLVSLAATTCYYPDGHTIAEDHTPCNSSATAVVSRCCYSSDLCLDNGLCLWNNVIYQGSCTDHEWGQGCPNYCPSLSSAMILVYCAQDENRRPLMSCGRDACLDNFTLPGGDGIMLREEQVAPLGLSDPLVLYAGTNLSRVSPAVSSSAQPTATGSSPEGQGHPTAAASHTGHTCTAKDIAAVGAGIGIPLALALAMAIVLLHREKKSKRLFVQPSFAPTYTSSPWQIQSPISPDDFVQPPKPQEPRGISVRQELDAQPVQKRTDGPCFTIEA